MADGPVASRPVETESDDERITVALLVATYNGGPYLEPLLRSLLCQTHRNTSIYVRDDGSTDGSADVIDRFAGDRVVRVRDSLGRLGPAASFLQLLSATRADVYMFCDQDDIWLPDKVAEAVRVLEAHGISSPVLFHTDLTVVDENAKVLAPSFHAHEGVTLPAAQELSRLVVQNCVVGCTMAVTDKLVEVSGLRDRRPDALAMHDWWLALCAACFGDIVYSPRADILYRQHRHNVSGVQRSTLRQRVLLQFSAPGIVKIDQYKEKVARQASAFVAFYGDKLPRAAADDLRAVGRLGVGSGFFGIASCLRRGIRLQSPSMNLAIVFTSLVTLSGRRPGPSNSPPRP